MTPDTRICLRFKRSGGTEVGIANNGAARAGLAYTPQGMVKMSKDYTEFEIDTAERLATLETKLDLLTEQFTNHLHAHQWWFRLLTGVLITSIANIVLSLGM